MSDPTKSNAPALLQCGECGELVHIYIPVQVWVEEVGVDGVSYVRAKVDDGPDWEQPVWDHQLVKHGPGNVG